MRFERDIRRSPAAPPPGRVRFPVGRAVRSSSMPLSTPPIAPPQLARSTTAHHHHSANALAKHHRSPSATATPHITAHHSSTIGHNYTHSTPRPGHACRSKGTFAPCPGDRHADTHYPHDIRGIKLRSPQLRTVRRQTMSALAADQEANLPLDPITPASQPGSLALPRWPASRGGCARAHRPVGQWL